jgi:hypothetical protein
MTDLERARYVGSVEMLDMIVSSLAMYPHGGGDVRVMAEVEKIVQAAYERTARRCAEIAQTRYEMATNDEFIRTGIHAAAGLIRDDIRREFNLTDTTDSTRP